jgi:concanavalin A-like lectin/glucanase superfamily protein
VVVPAYGGSVVPIEHSGSGSGVEFPHRCSATANCPQAIIRIVEANDLNPGVSDFSYGADLRVLSNQSEHGANVVQKGFAGSSSQWKMELAPGGTVRCGVRPTGLSGPATTAVSSVPIADGAWHRIECIKKGTTLNIRVDGNDSGSVGLPTNSPVANSDAMLFGGSEPPSEEQYSGDLDNVFFQLD